MLLTDFQTNHFPLPSRRTIDRKLKTANQQVHKFTKSKIRKARSKTRSYLRSQYYITSAAKDYRTAISHNEDIYLNAIMVVLVLIYASANTAANFLYAFFTSTYQIGEVFGINMSILMLLLFGVMGIMSAWLASFMLNILSFATMDGATQKKVRSARQTIRQGLRYASRTTGAWIAFLTALASPVALLGVATVLYAHFWKMSSVEELLAIATWVTIAGIAWLCYGVMHFGLVPYVAIFEPTIPLIHTFRRSGQLTKNKGHVFLLTTYCLLGSLLYAASIAASFVQRFTGFNESLFFTLVTLGILVTVNGIMVTFYRKRRLARK